MRHAILELAAVINDNLGASGSRPRADGFNGLDNVQALNDGSKHNVLAVQPRRLGRAQEELTASEMKSVSDKHDEEQRNNSFIVVLDQHTCRWCWVRRWPWRECPGQCAVMRVQVSVRETSQRPPQSSIMHGLTLSLKFSSSNLFPYMDLPPVPLWLVKSPPWPVVHGQTNVTRLASAPAIPHIIIQIAVARDLHMNPGITR